jgi:hypothetical protein
MGLFHDSSTSVGVCHWTPERCLRKRTFESSTRRDSRALPRRAWEQHSEECSESKLPHSPCQAPFCRYLCHPRIASLRSCVPGRSVAAASCAEPCRGRSHLREAARKALYSRENGRPAIAGVRGRFLVGRSPGRSPISTLPSNLPKILWSPFRCRTKPLPPSCT